MLSEKQIALQKELREINAQIEKLRKRAIEVKKDYSEETERRNAEYKLSKLSDAEKQMLRDLVVRH